MLDSLRDGLEAIEEKMSDIPMLLFALVIQEVGAWLASNNDKDVLHAKLDMRLRVVLPKLDEDVRKDIVDDWVGAVVRCKEACTTMSYEEYIRPRAGRR